MEEEAPVSNENLVPHVTYFDVRGRAEIIRLILEETNTHYTERRISIEEWPELKSSFTFGQLPVYEEGGLLLNQSNAIYRYLGRKLDLYGDTSLEHVRCDMVQETFVDAQSSIGGLFWNPDFEQLRGGYEQNELPALLQSLQDFLLSNPEGGAYWVGTRLSYVDFMAWHFLDYVRALSTPTLQKYPALWEFKSTLEARPNIAAYLASPRRPRTLTVSLCPFGGTPETS